MLSLMQYDCIAEKGMVNATFSEGTQHIHVNAGHLLVLMEQSFDITYIYIL